MKRSLYGNLWVYIGCVGFPIVVDDHLVILTKDGSLSIAAASAEAYEEKLRFDVFKDLVWSPPAFANGRLYLRSMGEVACVEITGKSDFASADSDTHGIVPGSLLESLVVDVAGTDDKASRIDEWMAKQVSFPVIEGDDIAHFIYRGEADDVAIVGDVVGWRFDRPMHRIDHTDLFYYSSRFPSDTRLTYRYVKNLRDPVVDSLNPRRIGSMMYGPASWFHMPGWVEPAHLQENAEVTEGRIDTLMFKSRQSSGTLPIEVYLPANYDVMTDRLPVAYVHQGNLGRALGSVKSALDYLIGRDVRPTIVIFLPPLLPGSGFYYPQYVGPRRDTYVSMLVDELVPTVDKTYRTITTADGRANIGRSLSGFMALYATFSRPGTFGKIGVQSIYWDAKEDLVMVPLIHKSEGIPLDIYLDWGAYDLKSPLEGVDIGAASRRVAEILYQSGREFHGGEVNDAFGWGSWKNRLNRVYGTLLPLEKSGNR